MRTEGAGFQLQALLLNDSLKNNSMKEAYTVSAEIIRANKLNFINQYLFFTMMNK